MKTIQLSDENLKVLQMWVASLQFSGSKADLQKVMKQHDEIEFALAHPLETTKDMPEKVLQELVPTNSNHSH